MNCEDNYTLWTGISILIYIISDALYCQSSCLSLDTLKIAKVLNKTTNKTIWLINFVGRVQVKARAGDTGVEISSGVSQSRFTKIIFLVFWFYLTVKQLIFYTMFQGNSFRHC